MSLSWSARRKLLYYAVGLFLATILFFVLGQALLSRQPSCFDGAQNGLETDVDCGGACAKLCLAEARSPNVLWARAVESSPQTYTAIAYVENRTQGAAARQVPYTFRLFDSNNELVLEREGLADLPPVAVVPVILPNIDVGTRVVARALFTFTSEPQWERVPVEALPQVRIVEQSLAADGARLSATISNEGFDDVRSLRVAGVVFDAQGVARAASLITIPRIPAKASEPAVFTWSSPVPDVARAEITILPSF